MDNLTAFRGNHHPAASVVITHYRRVVNQLRVKTFIQYIFNVLSAINRHGKKHTIIFTVTDSIIPSKGLLYSGKFLIINCFSIYHVATNSQNAVLYLIP